MFLLHFHYSNRMPQAHYIGIALSKCCHWLYIFYIGCPEMSYNQFVFFFEGNWSKSVVLQLFMRTMSKFRINFMFMRKLWMFARYSLQIVDIYLKKSLRFFFMSYQFDTLISENCIIYSRKIKFLMIW